MNAMNRNESISSSVQRLNRLLPLKARQDRLPATLKALHLSVIESLITRGRPPHRTEVAAAEGADQVDAALALLERDDLIVLSPDRLNILGAYPVTSEITPHAVEINSHLIHAMCALDALAVAPLFNCVVAIRSRCRVTGEAISVGQQGGRILEADPATTRVGVRWQPPSGGCAAHSLCMEMVFLKDDGAAAAWHKGDLQRHSVYTLEQAVVFGAEYFGPLLGKAAAGSANTPCQAQ